MPDQLISSRSPLAKMYAALFRAYGPQDWWPADTPVEVAVGAILTQNTAWTNVEKAIRNLQHHHALNLTRIAGMDLVELGHLIRSAGTYRVKARRLQAFARWVVDVHRGKLDQALRGDLQRVRETLLGIHGIGPETADAILLYAGHRASFVIDTYTRRVLRRHRLIDERSPYHTIKERFESELPADVKQFNEYHALLVAVGKRHCRARADCVGCPLAHFAHDENR